MSLFPIIKKYIVEVYAGYVYWKNEAGELHREDGPAIECSDGGRMWYINGKFHREGGPAIEFPSGDREWYINGKRHREDGPAVELADGTRKWWLNDQRHRVDGPAIEMADGTREWYLYGFEYDEEEFLNSTKKELTVSEIESLLGYSIKIVKG